MNDTQNDDLKKINRELVKELLHTRKSLNEARFEIARYKKAVLTAEGVGKYVSDLMHDLFTTERQYAKLQDNFHMVNREFAKCRALTEHLPKKKPR